MSPPAAPAQNGARAFLSRLAMRLNTPVPKWLLLAATLPLAGCQGLSIGAQAGFDSKVTALYRSAGEAGAVAMGQFGAHPSLLVRETELRPAEDCPGALPHPRARCMRTPDGQRGWLPLEREAARAAPGLPVSRLDHLV
jgi:hypothetical protein